MHQTNGVFANLFTSDCMDQMYSKIYSDSMTSDPWNPSKPWKTPEMVDTPEKVPEIPRKLGWSLKKIWKKVCKNWYLVQNDCSCGHIFNFGSYIFVWGLFFQFSQVCVHPGKQSFTKGFKGTWKTINWQRNCPGGCHYQLLNCWFISLITPLTGIIIEISALAEAGLLHLVIIAVLVVLI